MISEARGRLSKDVQICTVPEHSLVMLLRANSNSTTLTERTKEFVETFAIAARGGFYGNQGTSYIKPTATATPIAAAPITEPEPTLAAAPVNCAMGALGLALPVAPSANVELAEPTP